jgi:hypothetical protein
VAKSHEFTDRGSPSVKDSQNSPGPYAGSVGEMPVADPEKIAKNLLTSAEDKLGRGGTHLNRKSLNFLSAEMSNDGISDITDENFRIPDPIHEFGKHFWFKNTCILCQFTKIFFSAC